MIIFIAQTTKLTQTATIKSIRTSSNRILIQLRNRPTKLVIFNPTLLNLRKGNTIKFQGKQEIYKNKKQIVVDKIFLINSTTNT